MCAFGLTLTTHKQEQKQSNLTDCVLKLYTQTIFIKFYPESGNNFLVSLKASMHSSMYIKLTS